MDSDKVVLRQNSSVNFFLFQNDPITLSDCTILAKNLIIAESICTHYSNLSGRPDIFLGSGTSGKSGTLLFAKSKVQKNRVIVIQKEKRP